MPMRPPVYRPVLPGVPAAGPSVDQRSDDAAAYRKWYNLAAWKKHLRPRILARDKTCRRCAKDGVTYPPVATMVNHIIPHRGDPKLFWDENNCEGVCKRCHDGRIQKAEHRGYDGAVGEDGYYTDPNHPSNSRG